MHWETKKFMWLYGHTHCAAVFWNWICSISKVCLYTESLVCRLCVCFCPHSIMHLRSTYVVMLINPSYCWVVFHCVDIPACLSTYQLRDTELFTWGYSLAPCKYPVSHHISLSPNGFLITDDSCLNQVLNWELKNGDFIMLSFPLY